jgi:hypothetical protein
VTVTEPLEVPTVFDVNVTVMEHVPAGATLLPQLLVCENPPEVVMLVMESADAPVLVNATLWAGGGHGLRLEFNLQENLRLAGVNCAVPFVSVIEALLNLVASVIETALALTAAFAGRVAGPLKVDVPGLPVLAGFIVPHPGEQGLPPCVRVQFNP